MHRRAFDKLLKWKASKNRKPLVLRGARQVGKTTLIRQFSKTYDSYVELNLEKKDDRGFFEEDDIKKLISIIYLSRKVSPSSKSTLLFIDEIQESPQAIRMLRYFYEETPELHIIAAGSLLEFALEKIPSFPVGRIEYLYLHPVNFEEYLKANDNEMAIEAINDIPIEKSFHNFFLEKFQEYAIVGGMPEVVKEYIDSKNVARVSKIYTNLWQAYKDDVEKYAKNTSSRDIIRHVINTAPNETDRIKFEGFGQSNYRSREVGEALRALDAARIIRLIYPSTNVAPPLQTNLRKSPRLQFLDTGLLNQALQIQAEMISLENLDGFYRGKIISHLVYQELISIHDDFAYKPNFWVREEKDSNSEVDLIYQYKGLIIPIEIKAGKQGKLRSLHQFVERSDHDYAIRISSANFSIEEVKTASGKPYFLMNLPYYLSFKLPVYIDFFLTKRKSI